MRTGLLCARGLYAHGAFDRGPTSRSDQDCLIAAASVWRDGSGLPRAPYVSTGTLREALVGDLVSVTVSTPLS
jgi:hypothetical protein